MKRLALVIVLATTRAHAQAVVDPQNYPVERLRLAIDSIGVLDAEAGRLPADGVWNVGLWLGMASDPLVVDVDSKTGNMRVGELVKDRFGGSLSGAYSWRGLVEVGLELPLIIYQNRSDTLSTSQMPLGSLSSTGIGDLRLVPKVRLLHGPVDLAIIPSLTLPTGGGDAYFGERSVTFAPELAASHDFGGVRLAGDLGYRFRENSADVHLTVADELFLHAGVGYGFAKLPLFLAATLSGELPMKGSDGNASGLELLADASYRVAGPLVAFIGGGAGLESGYGVPDWRLFIGTRYERAPKPVDPDPDHDGVIGKADQCPHDPEDVDGFQDSDGCPDPDNDSDGIPDVTDKCPNKPETKNGYQDADGCPDTLPDNDGDGIPDKDDKCPDDAEDMDGFQDADGCPDADNDNDGVIDPNDKCPNQAGPVENQGCPDSDRDGDGVPDRLDSCPDEPGPPENHGCKQKQLVIITSTGLQILDKIQFAKEKAVIQSGSFGLLNNIAAVIKSHTTIQIEIAGFTSSDGDAGFNLDLSQRRAESVRQFLIQAGCDGTHLVAKGYGVAQPVADNGTQAGREANRRVEFRILAGPESAP